MMEIQLPALGRLRLRMDRQLRRFFLLFTLLLAAFGGGPQAFGQAFREYDLKAVFLFNFAQFVEWPAAAFPDGQTPFVIGVLGDDPFGDSLETTVAGETVNGRQFSIQHYRRVEDVGTCHILFVSRSETRRLDQIAAALEGRNILTVSDAEEFARLGGMVVLVTANNRIRLQINVDAARVGMLTISSKLLRPAEIVTTQRG